MDSLISHLIKNPSWVIISVFASLILFGVVMFFTFSKLYIDEKERWKEKIKYN